MFVTALHQLNSPQNVAMIVRSHVAFGGNKLVFIGQELPWKFKKGTQGFSRKLEKKCEIIYLNTMGDFISWCKNSVIIPLAIEISSSSKPLPNFQFPERTALLFGNEGNGEVRRCY